VNNQQNQMPNPMLTIRILWGALLFSSVIYGLVLNMLVHPEGGGGQNEMYGIVFPLIGLINAGLAVFLPEILSKGIRARIQDPSDLRRVLQQYFVPFIVRMALFESVVIMGFMWAFLTKTTMYYYPMWFVGAAGMIWSFPTETKILKWAQQNGDRSGQNPGSHVKRL
jgi:hypothetical protein